MSAEQKVVVVTGASQGIGAGIVEAFRQRNYQIVATSRSIKSTTDGDLLAVPGDVGDPQTAQLVFSAAIERFGRVDTLVNNAGMFMAKAFTAYTRNDYEAYLSTNVTGFFHMSQYALDIMGKQGRGHVVTITTSLVDQPMNSVPAALASLTKGALNAATRALAIEYASAGVRINAVSPGIIKTPMHPPEAHQALAALHPMGRMGKISDIVDAVLYLDGAGFVTGEILHVDGGQAAGHHRI
ncbi:SDR family NAD(P)-dependent oxidoreductase (plasmid) [Bradyrhizobium sp. CB82]|uniref:SDR family NAD(P)-dependent oxidoreductase n=1 Tax=Bradyrhizobium sp. CB82 TaxID=3039159 RepID=UPI0024B1256F|nr:SDR family oxidoreductase [Bradyrhizobium sp. CB82]WFU45667.1 SDR family NAD(P)-dependent oxidoreductase [Bradyrhizobium sp. CB82]